MEIFSHDWSLALGSALNASEAYRKAAGDWEGSLVFALRRPEGSEEIGTYLNLGGGICREARQATPGDVEGADYLLRADARTWRRLLAGETDPIFAIMTGKLELARGGVAGLLPHAAAAQQLVQTAAALGGRFPEA